MTIAEFIKDYGPALSLLVAATGWYVGNQQANIREMRKEVRSEIDEIAKRIDSLLDTLKQYHQVAGGTSEAADCALRIKLTFHDLDLRIARLKSRKKDLSVLLDLQQAERLSDDFFDLVTGGDFDSNSKAVLHQFPPLFSQSRTMTHAIVHPVVCSD